MSKQADTTESIKCTMVRRWSKCTCIDRSFRCRRQSPWNKQRASAFMIKAVLNGRGDELIDLAKVNLSG